jgi:hypothetical protein
MAGAPRAEHALSRIVGTLVTLAGLRSAGTFNRIVLTTRPSSDERNRIVMSFASATGKVLASSRSNRRERFLVVILVSSSPESQMYGRSQRPCSVFPQKPLRLLRAQAFRDIGEVHQADWICWQRSALTEDLDAGIHI